MAFCLVPKQSMAGGGSGENVAVFWYLDGRALDWLGQTGPGRGVQGRNSIGKQSGFF